jgi:DNA-binding CsgD family transcriptional regulator
MQSSLILPVTRHFLSTGTKGARWQTPTPSRSLRRSPSAKTRAPDCMGSLRYEIGGGSVRDADRLEPSPLRKTREPACPPSCRVCSLARKYGLTPREVTLIALISSGKSGRAISQTLGIGMPTIRRYCGGIHNKIGTHSRLEIGLWAIRERMVKSAAQPKSSFQCTGPLEERCPRHEIETAAKDKL